MNALDIIVGTCVGRWQGTGDLYALLARAADARDGRTARKLAGASAPAL